MAQYRKTNGNFNGEKVDSLTHLYTQILEIEGELKESLKEFQRFHEEDLIDLEYPNVLLLVDRRRSSIAETLLITL